MIEKEEVEELYKLIEINKKNKFKGKLKVGVDLGTSNIVLVVLDSRNKLIAAKSCKSKVVKDGIVVDYIQAVQVVRKLKLELEEELNTTLDVASCAIPPGIHKSSIRIIENVVESSGFKVSVVLDEPTAAATVLGIKEGAIVDLGGGTTGISILNGSKIIFTADEPTGGSHMTLTIAGYYNIDFDEAEKIKIDMKREREVFVIIKPVLEKMAYITKNFIKDFSVNKIYLVGGASNFNGIEEIFNTITGIRTERAKNPHLITPLGIAKNC